jgi:predicted small lipoprotein YifL
MHARITALLLLFAVFCLGGCGQTGPLYLPEEVPEEQSEKMPVQASQDTEKPEAAEQAKTSETNEPSE